MLSMVKSAAKKINEDSCGLARKAEKKLWETVGKSGSAVKKSGRLIREAGRQISMAGIKMEAKAEARLAAIEREEEREINETEVLLATVDKDSGKLLTKKWVTIAEIKSDPALDMTMLGSVNVDGADIPVMWFEV